MPSCACEPAGFLVFDQGRPAADVAADADWGGEGRALKADPR